MPPQIALALCIIFIFGVLVIDFRRKSEVSFGLWIPLIWLMIMASRPIAAWMTPFEEMSIGDLEGGSPIDRIVLSVLMVLGMFMLFKRKIYWGEMLKRNLWLLLFFLYCGLSILWSEFAGVAFKRWMRAGGSLLMILLVLSENNPIEAVKTLIKRCAYVLIPLSIMLIKYYPKLGVGYEFWTGKAMLAGVTTDKNALGRLSLVCGFLFFWDIGRIWRNEKMNVDITELFVSIVLLLMILWLLIKANSATATGVFIIGICSFMGLGLTILKRNVDHIKSIILLTFLIIILFQFLFNLSELFVTSLGRDMTFTTRTDIWKDLMNMGTNPLVGVGYDSFWLGESLKQIWEKYPGLSEAHNGYLEIYLELGAVGLFLLAGFLVSSFGKIQRSLKLNFEYGRAQFAFFIIFLVYNITEAASKGTTLMFFLFLLMTVELPGPSQIQVAEGTLPIGKDNSL